MATPTQPDHASDRPAPSGKVVATYEYRCTWMRTENRKGGVPATPAGAITATKPAMQPDAVASAGNEK